MADKSGMKRTTLKLTKHGRQYMFRYVTGDEDRIIGEIMRHADDARSDVNWIDAATLSCQVASAAAVDCLEACGLCGDSEGETETEAV